MVSAMILCILRLESDRALQIITSLLSRTRSLVCVVLPNVAVFSTRRYSHRPWPVYRQIPSSLVFSLLLCTRTPSLYLIVLALLLLPPYSISSACARIPGFQSPLLRRVALICKYGDFRRPVEKHAVQIDTMQSHEYIQYIYYLLPFPTLRPHFKRVYACFRCRFLGSSFTHGRKSRPCIYGRRTSGMTTPYVVACYQRL